MDKLFPNFSPGSQLWATNYPTVAKVWAWPHSHATNCATSTPMENAKSNADCAQRWIAFSTTSSNIQYRQVITHQLMTQQVSSILPWGTFHFLANTLAAHYLITLLQICQRRDIARLRTWGRYRGGCRALRLQYLELYIIGGTVQCNYRLCFSDKGTQRSDVRQTGQLGHCTNVQVLASWLKFRALSFINKRNQCARPLFTWI